MHLFDRNGKKYSARKASRPRFSNHRGRTWDYDPKTIDGRNHQFWSDTSWGTQYYFVYLNTWYAMHFWKNNEGEATDVATLFTVPPASHSAAGNKE